MRPGFSRADAGDNESDAITIHTITPSNPAGRRRLVVGVRYIVKSGSAPSGVRARPRGRRRVGGHVPSAISTHALPRLTFVPRWTSASETKLDTLRRGVGFKLNEKPRRRGLRVWCATSLRRPAAAKLDNNEEKWLRRFSSCDMQLSLELARKD